MRGMGRMRASCGSRIVVDVVEVVSVELIGLGWCFAWVDFEDLDRRLGEQEALPSPRHNLRPPTRTVPVITSCIVSRIARATVLEGGRIRHCLRVPWVWIQLYQRPGWGVGGVDETDGDLALVAQLGASQGGVVKIGQVELSLFKRCRVVDGVRENSDGPSRVRGEEPVDGHRLRLGRL